MSNIVDTIEKIGFDEDMYWFIGFSSPGDEIEIMPPNKTKFDWTSYLKQNQESQINLILSRRCDFDATCVTNIVGEYLNSHGHTSAYSKMQDVDHMPPDNLMVLRTELRKALRIGNLDLAQRFLKQNFRNVSDGRRAWCSLKVLRLFQMIKLQKPAIDLVKYMGQELKKYKLDRILVQLSSGDTEEIEIKVLENSLTSRVSYQTF